MHVSDVQKSMQYGEFFMQNRGKRHLRLGATSTVDSLLYGRDIDYSGEDPHKKFMSDFGSHAGLKSGEKPERPFRKPGYSLASTIDTVIWGRDFDNSGLNPHAHFKRVYKGYAGLESRGLVPQRHLRRGHAGSMQSTMDTIIYSRDLDKSGEDVHDNFYKEFAGGAGGIASSQLAKPTRKGNFSNQAIIDTVIYGRDLDGNGDLVHPHQAFMSTLEGTHAGKKAGDGPVRPGRKPGHSFKCTVDDVIFGRDIDGSGQDPQVEFMSQFAGHAGVLSGMRKMPVRSNDLQKSASEVQLGASSLSLSLPAGSRPLSARAASTGDLAVKGAGTADAGVLAAALAGAQMPAQEPARLSDAGQLDQTLGQTIAPAKRANPFKFNPGARGASDGGSTARSVRSSTTSVAGGEKPKWRR